MTAIAAGSRSVAVVLGLAAEVGTMFWLCILHKIHFIIEIINTRIRHIIAGPDLCKGEGVRFPRGTPAWATRGGPALLNWQHPQEDVPPRPEAI